MRKRILYVLLVVLLVLVPSTKAFAAYAYNYGRTNGFNYADDCVGYANACWNKLGLSYQSYLGSSFTKSTFLSNCPYGNGVLAYSHGNSSYIFDNGTGEIYWDEVVTRRNNDWKRLVFFHTCDSANSSIWAGSWGIQDGDGDLHCFIGWINFFYDNSSYDTFNRYFWGRVGDRYRIDQALSIARTASGVSNYYYYGNPYWSY